MLPFPCLPFVTDQDGRAPWRCHFDLQAQTYEDGHVTGGEVFRQCMRFLADAQGNATLQAGRRDVVLDVIVEAGAIAADRDDTSGRRGAAVAFLRLAVDMLRAGAGAVDHEQMADVALADARQRRGRWQVQEATRKAVFTDRMQRAKLAKRTAAAQAAGGAL
ncbi:hypothetical protein [Pseudaquabacterium pictum]|uniref:hypothetical protein n=1 Tax=Pseudaquabacterium pictum TaxID=2315236 RepID=UPI0010F49BDD|nr:hypothetical protein [Rubrivivax pictus]